MSSDKDDDYDDENENEDEDDDETIKYLNNLFDEIIGESKSFEEQIKLLEKREDLKGFWPYNNFGEKDLKSKYFIKELAEMLNMIDKKLFKQIFDDTLEILANKLINTTNKKENQIIVKNINKNKEKLYEMDPFHDWVIQPNSQRINLIDAYKLFLKFNETIQLDLI